MTPYQKGLADAAGIIARSAAVTASMAYALAREVWAAWWQDVETKKEPSKSWPEGFEEGLIELLAYALCTGQEIGRNHRDLPVEMNYRATWEKWVKTPGEDPLKVYWIREANKFLRPSSPTK